MIIIIKTAWDCMGKTELSTLKTKEINFLVRAVSGAIEFGSRKDLTKCNIIPHSPMEKQVLMMRIGNDDKRSKTEVLRVLSYEKLRLQKINGSMSYAADGKLLSIGIFEKVSVGVKTHEF